MFKMAEAKGLSRRQMRVKRMFISVIVAAYIIFCLYSRRNQDKLNRTINTSRTETKAETVVMRINQKKKQEDARLIDIGRKEFSNYTQENKRGEIDTNIDDDHEPYASRWQRRFASSEARGKKGGYLFFKHIRKVSLFYAAG